MRDFPIFSTEYGVSSLVLKQIPYKREAYIRIRDVQPGGLAAHLRECADFCHAAGAEKVFASGHGDLARFPFHTAVLEMQGTARVEEGKLANLVPVTRTTAAKWRAIYQEKMASVDNAQALEARDEQRIAESGGTYFVRSSGELLGIGWLEDCKLLAIASAKKGAGEAVMYTLMSLAEGSQITLEVASTNTRAIRLYERLGFVRTAELSRWYRVW